MPKRNGTGPWGEGPMTGRGMGPCGKGYRRGPKQGFGGWLMMRRRGRQWSLEEEKKALADEEESLKEELKALQEEKEALEKEVAQPQKDQ